ncbi:NADPH-dependent F420 reductase [Mucilaginibacter sp. NFX135]|uniref:NADPH-dependent F420 reductase n=1 Tax=Mucilaginibacter sp. NFX135 TaxID=3402687 RepID=UPI003AFB80FC
MKIGIIGTGAIGGIIAKKLAATGHEVKVYSSGGQQKLEERARELGVMLSTKDQIIVDVEVLIVSIPTIAIPELSDIIAKVSNNVIVIDTSNYYPFRDGEIEDLKSGKVESVWVSETLGRPVIKAFNNLLAHSLESGGKPEGAKDRIAMAVSGDDQQAKEIVSTLINDAGFDAVDAGTLADSWKHQPGTPAYCTELTGEELHQALADGDKENAAYLRDQAIGKFMNFSMPPAHEEVVAMNRSLFPENPKRH